MRDVPSIQFSELDSTMYYENLEIYGQGYNIHEDPQFTGHIVHVLRRSEIAQHFQLTESQLFTVKQVILHNLYIFTFNLQFLNNILKKVVENQAEFL